MKKNFLLILTLTLVFNSNAQELDDAYLESLPEGVRNDLEAKMEAKDNMEKPQYRRASTMIDKQMEEREKSERFGHNIFDLMQSSFMPINEPNLDSSYVLDFGDVLLLQLVGTKNKIEEMPVERDGSVNIPDIGKVFVSGLSLESASSVIKNRISTAFIGSEAFISLTNVRDIQVLVSGNAFNPGIYTLNGNSNVLHALSMAGGIVDDGSYRLIDVIRNGEIIYTLDLYDFFISATGSFSKRLRTGDSIFVRPAESLVSVSTGVKRPGLYELLSDETFEDLIFYANGLSKNADTTYIAIERLNKEDVRLIKLDEVNKLNEIVALNGDTLFIKEFIYSEVTLSGAIEVPGRYIIREGETLSGLIKRAGGYKDTAYPFGGHLENIRAQEINELAKEKLYNQYLENILLRSETSDNNSLPLILEELRDTEASGRVIAEFNLDAIRDNSRLDTTLEDGDEILIPYITQQVYIYGEINNDGTIRYKAGENPSYYIKNGGGTKRTADTENIFIIHPNGETVQINRNNRLSFLNANTGLDVYPGSIIFVPRKSALDDPIQVASIWAPIVSSLALSLTSLSVLNTN